MQRACDAQRRLVAAFFFALLMALDFDEDVVVAVEADELLNERAASGFTAIHNSCGERAFVAAGEADEAFSILRQIVVCGRAFRLGLLAHLKLRDELAKVLV